MPAYIREGECNRCGQCCGAEGSPNQHSPWPNCWPESLGSRSRSEVMRLQWPHAELLPIDNLSGKIEKVQNNGTITVDSKQFHYVWVQGSGFCKDTSAKHDGSSHSLECPFLDPDPGDGTRPCGLVGTSKEYCFTDFCQDGPIVHGQSGFPPKKIQMKQKVDLWFENHPLCSFTYKET